MSGSGTSDRRSGRRRLLALAAVGIAVIAFVRGVPWVLDQATAELGFTPVDDPPGFRRLTLVGTTSGAIDPFAGISGGAGSAEPGPAVLARDLCSALFGQSGFESGVVPIAFFSDYNCPNCELLSEDLLAIEAEGRGRIHLRRHEWPILGQSSETSARAAIAAGRQGAQREFNRRLQGTAFEPTREYLKELAGSAGIDPARLFADMASDEVTRELHTSAALVRRLAFPGTPALVVGRTIVVGTLRESTLRALIETERAEGPPPGCARSG
jgi:predicted DsbA family dithiol-disulfide isomerase